MDTRTQQELDIALLKAAKKGSFELVKQLIEQKANVNTLNSREETPLLIAAHYGHDRVVARLLKLGADVNACDRNQKTALMISSALRNTEIVSWLIAYGAALDMQDNNGNTALMLATQKKHSQVMMRLLEADADTSIVNKQGKTVFDLVANDLARFILASHLENKTRVTHTLSEITAILDTPLSDAETSEKSVVADKKCSNSCDSEELVAAAQRLFQPQPTHNHAPTSLTTTQLNDNLIKKPHKY